MFIIIISLYKFVLLVLITLNTLSKEAYLVNASKARVCLCSLPSRGYTVVQEGEHQHLQVATRLQQRIFLGSSYNARRFGFLSRTNRLHQLRQGSTNEELLGLEYSICPCAKAHPFHTDSKWAVRINHFFRCCLPMYCSQYTTKHHSRWKRLGSNCGTHSSEQIFSAFFSEPKSRTTKYNGGKACWEFANFVVRKTAPGLLGSSDLECYDPRWCSAWALMQINSSYGRDGHQPLMGFYRIP